MAHPHKKGQHGGSWTDERVESLKALIAEGLSYTAIAQRLGAGLTRNAVGAKLDRLGLSGSKPDETARRINLRRSFGPASPAPAPAVAPAETVRPVHESGTATLLTINGHQCKWPIGDPQAADFALCCRFKTGHGPYCESHALRKYTS
jgi:GcrA cell cycle regulator